MGIQEWSENIIVVDLPQEPQLADWRRGLTKDMIIIFDMVGLSGIAEHR